MVTIRTDGPIKIIKADGSLVVLPAGQSLRVHSDTKIIALQANTTIEVSHG